MVKQTRVNKQPTVINSSVMYQGTLPTPEAFAGYNSVLPVQLNEFYQWQNLISNCKRLVFLKSRTERIRLYRIVIPKIWLKFAQGRFSFIFYYFSQVFSFYLVCL